MKRRLLTLCSWGLVIFFSVSVGYGQAPKPGAEHKKLGVLIGSWSIDGEYKPGNGYGAPAGKFTGVERYQWIPGEFFLRMDREGKASTGDFRHSIMFGYDPIARKHTGEFFDFTGGGSASATIAIAGNTWNWLASGHTGDGKTYQERCPVTFASGGASYTVKCETSADGKTWSPSYEAKATKSK
jgi:hypothetical protein